MADPSQSTQPRLDGLPRYTSPNVSCLEAFRAEIARARQQNWPFRAIAEMLREQHQLVIRPRAICGFCKRRGIEKGVGETQPSAPSPAPVAAPTTSRSSALPDRHTADALTPRPRRKKKRFVYTEGPLRTRANGLLKDDH